MANKLSIMAACLMLFALSHQPAPAAERRALETQLPAAASRLPMLGWLPATNRLQLAIGLPLRNREALTNLLQQLYDRRSTNFHRYLTPAQFADQFGPTEQDYQSVIDFAKSSNLEVVNIFGNRVLVSVSGKVDDIEKAFQVHLGTYHHPTENRTFFAPDAPPSVAAGLPIHHVTGLDNYVIPHPCLRKLPQASRKAHPAVQNGSGTNNIYLGSDFRHAYIPGANSLTGAGQVVALYELDGYTPGDIAEYATLAGVTEPPLQNVILPGASGLPGSSDDEVSLDIEMVIAMAPGVSKIIVVEGPDSDAGNEAVMTELASENNGIPIANQISSSFAESGNPDLEPQLIEMAIQGQSFFRASGDDGAVSGGVYTGTVNFNYLTEVGGTELSMKGAGVSWQAEQVWDYQWADGASRGGIASAAPIPEYQMGIDMSKNGGSMLYRNFPDVAMCADYIEIVDTDQDANGNYTLTGQIDCVGGTSAAAPLWAAFTALVNQQAAAQGKPAVGFLNPALYEIAKSPSYTNCFHDVTVGNNTNSSSDNLFFATTGYDLCTGLGTPNGMNLVNALVGMSGPVFVDFNYTGTQQDGNYYTPFNTMAKGTNAVSSGGTIFIKTAGSSPETMKISKPMKITAIDGPASIGN